MPGGVYLIKEDGGLVEMSERPYGSEDLLQEMLARYPDLLAGDQMDEDEPRRWLLISREVPLASEEEGGGRWYVDHLFVDQDAVPTIVEVKRGTDNRIRREVVGQMLDYAANAVIYWPVEALRARFEADAGGYGRGLDALLGAGADPEAFWQGVKTNLQAGRVRLVFVADEIPPELRRVVEFLNEQMDPTEVLAVEIKQYVGGNQRTLVPRLLGQTAKASPVPRGQTWDEASFFRVLRERKGSQEAEAAHRVLRWAKEKGLGVGWGKGRHDGSFTPELDHEGTRYKFVRLYTYGSVEVLFEYLMYQPPFDDESVRLALLDRLNGALGTSVPADKIAGRPTIDLGLLGGEDVMARFLETLNWLVEKTTAP